MIRCAEGLSTVPDSDAAIAEIAAKLAEGLAGDTGDLTFVFASADHADSLGLLARTLQGEGGAMGPAGMDRRASTGVATKLVLVLRGGLVAARAVTSDNWAPEPDRTSLWAPF